MPDESLRIGRRALLKGGALTLAAASVDAAALSKLFADENAQANSLRVGLLTDLHYADKPAAGTRHYRETPAKLAEAAGRFGEKKPAFVVELGDLIDAADSVETERRWLATIDKEYSAIADDRHYVLGNHCVDTLTKEEFLGDVGREKSYYSFDRGDFHFVVLDACFRNDGVPYGRKNSVWNDANVPPAELEWLAADLAATNRKTIVFAHQRLDVENDHGVNNSPDVRKALEASGKVLAVFQGHSHKNDYREIDGIHYATLVAMVEGSGEANSGYSLLELLPTGDLQIRGFRNQKSYDWA